MFKLGFEKVALNPSTVQKAVSRRLQESSLLGRSRADRISRDVADEYRLFKATKKPISPTIQKMKKDFPKVAAGTKLPGPLGGMKALSRPTRVDPITVRDALGASNKKPFSSPISQFGSRPRKYLKAPSQVRSGVAKTGI